MTKECAQYLNETAGRWNKVRSDAAVAKLQKMNAKTYAFTVTDSENVEKPIVWCQLTTNEAVNDQTKAVDLICYWLRLNGIFVDQVELEDLAYAMRRHGHAWLEERWCFELTPVVG